MLRNLGKDFVFFMTMAVSEGICILLTHCAPCLHIDSLWRVVLSQSDESQASVYYIGHVEWEENGPQS